MKLNIDAIVSRYLEKPNLKLLINHNDGTVVPMTWKEYDQVFMGKNRFQDTIYGRRRDLALYCGPDNDRFADIRQRFLKKRRLYSKVNPSLVRSASRFNALVKDKGLWDEFVAFFIECEAADLSQFVMGNEFVEEEASKDEYQAIGNLLKEYEFYRFWNVYSDSVYFSSHDEELSGTGFVVLGHQGETFGIAFYNGAFGYHDYAGVYYCEEPMGPLGHTIGTLGTTVSLYCDPKGKEIIDEDSPSPYGEERLSSITICKGRGTKNHLGKTTARAIIRGLRYAIDLLNASIKADVLSQYPFKQLALDFKRTKNTFLYRLDPYYSIAETRFLPGPYYPWNKVSFAASKKTKSIYSFCFRVMPDSMFPDKEEPTWLNGAYIALLCDETNGLVLSPALLESHGAPFIQRLAELGDERFAKIPTPKTIYVNSEFDAQIAEFLFAPYLKQGTKIELTDESLVCDDAYDSLCSFMEKGDDIPRA